MNTHFYNHIFYIIYFCYKFKFTMNPSELINNNNFNIVYDTYINHTQNKNITDIFIINNRDIINIIKQDFIKENKNNDDGRNTFINLLCPDKNTFHQKIRTRFSYIKDINTYNRIINYLLALYDKIY